MLHPYALGEHAIGELIDHSAPVIYGPNSTPNGAASILFQSRFHEEVIEAEEDMPPKFAIATPSAVTTIADGATSGHLAMDIETIDTDNILTLSSKTAHLVPS